MAGEEAEALAAEVKSVIKNRLGLKYPWPGNIRELENLLERSVALSTTNIILPDSLALSIHKRRWIEGFKDRRFDLDDVSRGVSLDIILEEIERAYLKKALDCSNGNKNKAAELLGLGRNTLTRKLQKLDNDRNGDDAPASQASGGT